MGNFKIKAIGLRKNPVALFYLEAIRKIKEI